MNTKQQYCSGCRNDFYNDGNNDIGVKQCWSLKDAKVVTRFRLGWWTQPLNAKCFEKVKTLDCHHATGRYAHFKELPAHCRSGALALLLCILLPTFAHADTIRIPASVFIGVNALDLWSTHRALESTPGAHESNRMMVGSDAKRIALKAASTGAMLVLASKVGKQHPKLAKGLLFGASGIVGLVVAHNARVGR